LAVTISAGELIRIFFGCGNFGGLGSSPALRDKGDGREQAMAMLDHAWAAGITRFDTANTYGGGESERVLGEWLGSKGHATRAGLQVATKVGNPNGCPEGDTPLSRVQITRHLDESLRRLGLEQVDLYYIHEFDHVTPLDETLEAMDRALIAGKIAEFGISNATAAELQAVLALVSGTLRQAFTHVQNEFNLLVQGDLAEVIPLCRAEGLSYVAFSPLAGGLLSGKYQAGHNAQPGTRVSDAPGFYAHLLTPETFEVIETLRQCAAANGWTVPGAALRFILDTPGVGSLIIAPRSAAQFDGYGINDGGAMGLAEAIMREDHDVLRQLANNRPEKGVS
jgi:aryl-alcohol dehydrogenase-like predicted oxidoreductase